MTGLLTPEPIDYASLLFLIATQTEFNFNDFPVFVQLTDRPARFLVGEYLDGCDLEECAYAIEIHFGGDWMAATERQEFKLYRDAEIGYPVSF